MAQKHLLIVFHSMSGGTQAMVEAVLRGAQHPDISDVEVRVRRAFDAGSEDLVWADGLILGAPENFGYMAGAVKDFFDRTFYPMQGRLEGFPYAICIKAGNDGTGAVNAIRRIAKGFPWREVHEPVLCVGQISDDVLGKCEELGTAMAAGLELGMY
ncbi:MAG: multimeric flavodoxin WrbA [Gammaproteobacteria bacterium]